MTIVEAVLAVSTLWGMYRKSQASVPGEATAAQQLAEIDMAACPLPPTAFAAADPTLLAPEPTLGNALPVTTLPSSPELPSDATFVQELLQTPTVIQQLWSSPTRGRFIVTIGMVGDLKQVTVTPDTPLRPTYGDDMRLPVLIEPVTGTAPPNTWTVAPTTTTRDWTFGSIL